MLRTTRSKIASKVAKIEITDDFQFSKWLRVPQVHNHEVAQILYYDDIKSFEVEGFEIPSLFKPKFLFQKQSLPEYKVKFKVAKPKAYLIFFGLTRPQLFQMKERFLGAAILSDYNSTLTYESIVIDQSDVFIVKPASTIKHSHELPESVTTDIELLGSGPAINDESDRSSAPAVADQFSKIDVPEITDHLASLVPQIYNIELLNNEKLENLVIDSRNYEVRKLKLPMIDKVEVPDITDLIQGAVNSVSVPMDKIQSPDLKYFSTEISFSSHIFKVKIDTTKTIVKKVLVQQTNLETKVIDPLTDKKVPDKKKDDIRLLLSSYRELSWEEYVSPIRNLKPEELIGSRHLAENNFAVYADELGYDKYNSACCAINYLQKKGKVKSVLIIADQSRLKDYWTHALQNYASGFKPRLIQTEVNTKISGNSIVWLLDVNDLGKTELRSFDQTDLLIFDEHLNLKTISEIADELVNHIQPHYLWLLTAVANKNYNEKLLETFDFSKKVEIKYLGRELEEIQKDDPVVTYKDFWLDLDEMQAFEYQEALTQSKAELTKLSTNPNPLRFKSVIFTIIHKLKQILNFSSFRNISPKANLLIEQVEAIYRNKRKAIVFTQYDDNGMKKIEKAFEMNNIKHIVARNGMSAEDLKISLANYYDRKEIPVLLTNMKPSRLNINLNKVTYIINFDLWWNPVTNWQNEDEMGLNEIVESPVFVFNYYIRNSFEDALTDLLKEKGLFNRKLFDNIKSETISELIHLEDWLTVFGLNDQYYNKLRTEKEKLKTSLHTLDLETYKSLMTSLFSYLGYRDISIMDIADEQMFYIIGTARRGTTPVHLHGKCCLKSDLRKEDYEEVIYLKQGANEIKRKFVITNANFEERVPNGTTYLDENDLINNIVTLGLKSYLTKKKNIN